MYLTSNTKAARPSEIIRSQGDVIREQNELIDVLKGALAALGAPRTPAPAPWMRELTVQERAVIGVLFAGYPRTSSRYDLLENIPGRDHVQDRQVQIVNILVHKIRKKLGADAIVTERGLGFRLGQRFYEGFPKEAV